MYASGRGKDAWAACGNAANILELKCAWVPVLPPYGEILSKRKLAEETADVDDWERAHFAKQVFKCASDECSTKKVAQIAYNLGQG